MWLRLTCLWMLGATCGCAAAAPVAHVPVKQDYAIERTSRSALAADHELQPELDAVRWLKVQIDDVYNAAALFYSDGTLQVEVHEERTVMHPPVKTVVGRERRPSARLTAAELSRLKQDLSALDGCRLQTEEDSLRDLSYGGHGPTARFEVLTQPDRAIVTVASELGHGTPTCRRYVKFVLDLIKATVDYEYGLP